nr:hypothetical protein [Pseudescherichia vulneris]
MGGDSKSPARFAPLIFYVLIFISTGVHVDRHHAFRWVLEQSLGKREKTVSNRVINGKSHLAITDLARNNEAVFRLNLVKQGNLRNDQFCLSDHPRQQWRKTY